MSLDRGGAGQHSSTFRPPRIDGRPAARADRDDHRRIDLRLTTATSEAVAKALDAVIVLHRAVADDLTPMIGSTST